MKYALFALGIVLLLGGSYSIYAGSEIIEIERGWSSVIAGTTAVVGGLLIFCLVWIIKTLEQLRAAIETRDMSVAVKGTLPPAHEAFVNTPDLPIAPMAWPPHTASAHASTQESGFDELALSQAEPAPHEEAFEEDLYATFPSEAEARPQAPIEARAALAERTSASPSIKDLWQRVAREIDAPELAPRSPKPGLSAAVAAATAHATMPEAAEEGGDWLDDAFADFGSANAPTPSRAQPAAEPRDAAEIERHRLEPHMDVHMEETAAPLARQSAPAEPPSEEPAVIGRYEAEGTHYVMFADGSIEAQSERGVARFKSMADLKAYFETEETPQAAP